MVKARSALFAAAAVVGLTVGVAAPAATAAPAAIDRPLARGSWVDQEGYIRQSPQQLAALAEVQTSADTEKIANSGLPVNLLLDPQTGEILAADYAEKAPTLRVPTAIGTSCTTGAARLLQMVSGRSVARCFNGTGSTSVSVFNTYWASAGASNAWLKLTFSNGTTSTLLHGSSCTYSPSRTTVKVERGFHS